MPRYQYACTACDERLEVVQTFTDDPLTDCPACNGRLRKVFSAVGIVFKGSGFYRTDSRQTTKATTESGNGSSSEPTTESKSPAGSESTAKGSSSTSPAPAPAAS